MSPEELELMRIKIKSDILLTLLRGLYTGLANSSPSAREALKLNFAALRKQHSIVAIKGIDPAYSDMVAGESQEALEDALSFIESGIRAKP